MVLILVGVARAATPPPTWPPKDGPGSLLVHYGEEHWNDADGLTLLPKVVEDSIRYAPTAVTMSGDKANNGVPSELGKWLEIMSAYDRAGIPYFAAVGNHDRDQGTGENALTESAGGVTPVGDFKHYRELFKSRPYPAGDAAPYAQPGFGPPARPAGDPDGAASHFYADVPGARVIFFDNSCWGINHCEAFQTPPDAEGLTQYEYLAKHAGAAKAEGRRVFVVMHMPTQDPGDQNYRKELRQFHTMGKSAAPDNQEFERAAQAAKVDGVFVAHIKGQFQYLGSGSIPYFIDGGAGGELYTLGPVGTDHGYWHGYRLIRVADGRWETDAVPILTPGSLKVTGPDALKPGERARFEGFGAQPVKNHSAKVDALELRDPNPTPRSSSAAAAWLAWLAPMLFALFAIAAASPARAPRRRMAPRTVTASLAAAVGFAGIAAAQQSEPTSTPKEALPNPARIWTSADPAILAPVGSASDDPRRDTATQTADGEFAGVCPGRTTLWLSAGWETRGHAVHVASGPGAIARRLEPGARRLRRGRRARVASVNLAQPARVRVRVSRGRRSTTLLDGCRPAGRRVVAWTPTRRGRHTLAITVLSDRKPVTRRVRITVR